MRDVSGFNATMSVAVEDFTLTQPRVITEIVFFTAPQNNPHIVGGDWFIWDGNYGANVPIGIFHRGHDANMVHEPTGFVHPSYGMIFRNKIVPIDEYLMPGQNPVLQPGRYFVGFRTAIDSTLSDGKNGALASQSMIGLTRAWWNMSVDQWGGLTGQPWQHMNAYGAPADLEWLFYFLGY